MAEIERLQAEIEPLRIALGLLTTIKPTMEIDITDPVGMAQQIAAHVAAEIERLRGHVELLLEGDGKAQAEIERLRGLLEDACRWHEQFPIQRVREALGDVSDA